MSDTKVATDAPVVLPIFQVVRPNFAALRVDPGTYIFLVDPYAINDPDLIINAIRSIPDVHGPIIPVAPGHLVSLEEEEARALFKALCKHFGSEGTWIPRSEETAQ